MPYIKVLTVAFDLGGKLLKIEINSKKDRKRPVFCNYGTHDLSELLRRKLVNETK